MWLVPYHNIQCTSRCSILVTMYFSLLHFDNNRFNDDTETARAKSEPACEAAPLSARSLDHQTVNVQGVRLPPRPMARLPKYVPTTSAKKLIALPFHSFAYLPTGDRDSYASFMHRYECHIGYHLYKSIPGICYN